MWHQYPWNFGEVLCDAKTVTTEAITYVTILTIMAFTTERYLVVCKQHKSNTRTARKVIILIWITSFLTALPWIFFSKVNYLYLDGKRLEQSSWCSVPFDKQNSGSLNMVLATMIIYYLIPIITVLTLYLKIADTFASQSKEFKRVTRINSILRTENHPNNQK